jgi:hypothetical protein
MLSVGIGSFASDGASRPGTFNPLPFAGARSARVTEALGSLGYQHHDPPADLGSAALIGQHVSASIADSGPDDVLVVHVLSHGHLAETGSLYVIGPDGRTHPLTDVEHWLKAVQDFPGRPCTLFLLDLCHSGVAARLPWQFALADGSIRAWVIAASQPDRPAFDGQFSQAVSTVLDRLRQGELDIDHSVKYVPIGTVAREIRREVDALIAASGGLRQQVTCSAVDISAQVDVPFFANPAYRDDPRNEVRGRIDNALAPFLDDLDEVFDARHFIGRAAGHGPMADRIGTGCFSGRKAELTGLTAWINGDEDGPVRVVTGSAGVGKSALIGVLVCAAHPALRVPTRMLWEQVERVPARVPHMAAAHARQRTVAEVTMSLASQLGLGSCSSPGDLIAKIRQSPTRPLLVVDALDEALSPVALMEELLIPLATGPGGPDEPTCRLLVGVRAEPEYGRLRTVAEARDGLVDLDRVPDDRLREDLEEYVGKLLRSQVPYDQRAYAGARATFAAAVAETLVSRRAGHRWGEFLVAALYAYHLLTAYQPIADQREAERLGLLVPSQLPEVLEADLRSRRQVPFLRPVLAVLAHALGEGMPATLIRAVAPAFAAVRSPSAAEITAALEAARFYLRHTVDTDGTTIYRLFHQGLADYLRQHPVAADAAAPENTARLILESLLGVLPKAAAGSGHQWALAEPYLLRHASQHAVAADQPELVANDLEFFVYADPDAIRQLPYSWNHGIPAFYMMPYGQGPDERRQLLAMRTAITGHEETARRLANPPGQTPLPWQPNWAAQFWEQAPPGYTVTDPSRIDGAIAATLPSGPAIVAVSENGGIQSWDLATGLGLRYWHVPTANYRRAARGELREFRTGGQSAVLATSPDGQAWICMDPASGGDFIDGRGDLRAIADFLMPQDYAPFSKKATSISNGRIIGITATGRSLTIVDHFTNEIIGEMADSRSSAEITTLAALTAYGRPCLVTGGADGSLSFWDLITGSLHDMIRGALGQIIQVIPAAPDHLAIITPWHILALKWNGTPEPP